MEKIAIITTGFNPVPAVKGGAIQVLDNYIIDDNEKKHYFNIDLYTIYDKKIKDMKYKHTNIIMIKENNVLSLIYKIINKINKKIFHFEFLLLDYPNKVIKKLNNKCYDKIIIENNMYVYKKIISNYKYKDVPLYFRLHNDVGDADKNYKNSKLISQTATKVVCVSKYLMKSFNKLTNSNITSLLYNCIDFNIYNEKLISDKEQIKESLGFDNKEIYFLYTGRVVENKGVGKLLDAFLKLQEEKENVSLIIVGFNSDRKKTTFEKNILNKIKDNKKIYALNFMKPEKLKKYIIASDVVVIPTVIEEGFGVVALEAMAMKKAIIATNSGGLLELLDDNCSIIVDRNNLVFNLYNAMNTLCNNKKMISKLSSNAFLKIKNRKEFNRENYFEQFIDSIK